MGYLRETVRKFHVSKHLESCMFIHLRRYFAIFLIACSNLVLNLLRSFHCEKLRASSCLLQRMSTRAQIFCKRRASIRDSCQRTTALTSVLRVQRSSTLDTMARPRFASSSCSSQVAYADAKCACIHFTRMLRVFSRVALSSVTFARQPAKARVSVPLHHRASTRSSLFRSTLLAWACEHHFAKAEARVLFAHRCRILRPRKATWSRCWTMSLHRRNAGARVICVHLLMTFSAARCNCCLSTTLRCQVVKGTDIAIIFHLVTIFSTTYLFRCISATWSHHV